MKITSPSTTNGLWTVKVFLSKIALLIVKSWDLFLTIPPSTFHSDHQSCQLLLSVTPEWFPDITWFGVLTIILLSSIAETGEK